MSKLKMWVAVAPSGAIHIPTGTGSGKRAAIREAREQVTLDVELKEHRDFPDYLAWADARAAGYRVRLATITVAA